jgi:hypothetical protein
MMVDDSPACSTVETLQPNSSSNLTHAAVPTVSSTQWTAELEQLMEEDREYFLHHPSQDYFVRPIAPVEILEAQAMGRKVSEHTLMLVGEIAPGCRTRLAFVPGKTPPIAEFKALKHQTRQGLGLREIHPRKLFKTANRARPKPNGFG